MDRELVGLTCGTGAWQDMQIWSWDPEARMAWV